MFYKEDTLAYGAVETLDRPEALGMGPKAPCPRRPCMPVTCDDIPGPVRISLSEESIIPFCVRSPYLVHPCTYYTMYYSVCDTLPCRRRISRADIDSCVPCFSSSSARAWHRVNFAKMSVPLNGIKWPGRTRSSINCKARDDRRQC